MAIDTWDNWRAKLDENGQIYFTDGVASLRLGVGGWILHAPDGEKKFIPHGESAKLPAPAALANAANILAIGIRETQKQLEEFQSNLRFYEREIAELHKRLGIGNEEKK